ncbi:DUF4214 domain-containing protein [Pseudoduganella sp. OTU4001]|uniref:DUF4214 domain-containing protein n=1 Tax=Pseudoduganella sp. OTU4001 TaxID=3043854 RepID=UPI00313B753C
MGIYATDLQKLYVEYFNRPADPAGLQFWETVITNKQATLATVAAEFAKSAEYKAAYAGKTTAQIIDTIYVNIFGHAADNEGLLFWANAVSTGAMTIDAAVTEIAKGAQGTDKVAFDSKVAAAEAFTAKLVTVEGGVAAYNGDAANLQAKIWMAGIIDEASLEASTSDAALNTIVSKVAAAADPLLAASMVAEAAAVAANTDATAKAAAAVAAAAKVDTATAASKAAADKAAATDATALTATATAAKATSDAAAAAKTAADAAVVAAKAELAAAIAAGDAAAVSTANGKVIIAESKAATAAADATKAATAYTTADTAAKAAVADDAAAVTAAAAVTTALTAAATAATAATAAAATANTASTAFTAAAAKTAIASDDAKAVTVATEAAAAVKSASAAAATVTVAQTASTATTANATAATDAAAAAAASTAAAAAITGTNSLATANAAIAAAAAEVAAAAKAKASADAALVEATKYDTAAKVTTTTTDDTAAAAALTAAQAAVTAATAAVAAAAAHATAAAGLPANYVASTFTLTIGADTGAAFTGAKGEDKFNANVSTLSALDALDGGDGVDTLTILGVDKDGKAAEVDVTLPSSVTNIEQVVINSTASSLANDAADISGWTGATSANIKVKGDAEQVITLASTTSLDMTDTGGNGIKVNGGGGTLVLNAGAGSVKVNSDAATDAASAFTSITVSDATTVDIKDTTKSDGTIGSTLTTVSVTDATGATTIEGKGVVNVSVTNMAAAVTVTNSTASHTMNLTLDGATAGTFKDTAATTLIATASGTASKGTTFDLNSKVTSLTIAGDKALSTALSNDGSLTTVTSTNTAGATITTALGNDVTFTGAAGNDSIIVGATNKTITTGAGNDTVEVTVSVLGTTGSNGSIDAGDGTADTLKFSTFATAVTASNTAAFEGTISGFERLELSGANAAAGAAIKLNNFDDVSYVTLSATNTETMTISGMASGGTLAITKSQTDNKDITVTVNNATTGTADSLNLLLSATAGLTTVDVTVADVETIAINSDDSATTASGITHALDLAATSVKTLTITGDAGLDLTGSDTGTALTTFDASGITKGGVTWAAGALAASSVVKGSASGTNVIDLNSATTAKTSVTYTGGTGADQIVSTNDNNNTFTLGNGANTINNGGAAGNGNNTVTAGTGNDVIKLGDGDNNINVGAGDNTVVVGNGDNTIVATTGDHTITVGTGINSITITSDLNDSDTITFGIPATANNYSTVTGLTTGDILNFADDGVEVWMGGSASAAKIVLDASTALFADYIAAATATTTGVGTFAWFQFGGNTYVVEDKAVDVGFKAGEDIVVKLVGLVDLSTATLGDHAITLG